MKLIGKKFEFEAEGVSVERLWQHRLNCEEEELKFFLKIGGCEAKTDLDYAMQMKPHGIIAPMIESPFAREKFECMVSPFADKLEKISINIETITAVNNIDEILNSSCINMITIGRSDLSSSMGDSYKVDDEIVLEKVLIACEAAKKKKLSVTVGGSVTAKSLEFLNSNENLIDFTETRNNVLINKGLTENDIINCLKSEINDMENTKISFSSTLKSLDERISKLNERIV